MSDFPILTLSILVPLVGAVALMFLPERTSSSGTRSSLPQVVALGISLVTLVVVGVLTLSYDTGAEGYQFSEVHEWIGAFGAHYAVGVDGIGLTLILLTAILTPVVIAASWRDGDRGRWSTKSFFAWMLALEGLALGTFAAIDVFLFYVLFEATLIPIYFLIGGFGGAKRSYAAVKFLIFSLLGGLVMLASVIGLYVESAGVRGRSDVPAHRAGADHGRGRHGLRPLAVRGLLLRLRHQGPHGAGAHVAARRRRRGDPRHLGAAGLDPRQDRHLRHDAVLPRALPGGLAVGHPGGARAGRRSACSTAVWWPSTSAACRA